jgi:stage V sporulation protein R
MELVDQKTKRIMEGCKERAHGVGLRFGDETLEYIVTNRDLINLTPKYMIPTLYDYWVHDLEVLKEKGRYELYPSNPYETVINTRPAISFYNDNNPDWMNVMIFYHVLAHIDFFRNNLCYRNTWDFDFTGQALADKRLIAKLRSDHGRWVDYVIEFSRGIDNLVGYHAELARDDGIARNATALDYYFDVFLQDVKKVSTAQYIKEIERYNAVCKEKGDGVEEAFFATVRAKNPEFESLLERYRKKRTAKPVDLLQYVLRNSEFLKKEENAWMKSVMEVVRKTSLFFQPQIRTKIMNEGWASYWHERLFLADDRIRGHEVDFAKAHSGVASLPRVGLNPYALGMRLFEYIEDLGDKGRRSFDYQRIADAHRREQFDSGAGKGRELIYDVRRQLSDALFIDMFVDQDFVDRYRLFVAGRRLNRERMTWEYYVKSRSAEAYRTMLREGLYHPPYIEVDGSGSKDNVLKLTHRFEGKPLVTEYIHNTMLGIEYLWGAPVELETSEVVSVSSGGKSYTGTMPPPEKPGEEPKITWRRVRYRMKNRKLTKKEL